MFEKLFGKKDDRGKVFIIPFHVKPLEKSIMPPELGGAYVSCYAAGETYVQATELALAKLTQDGLHPEEILQPINEMPVAHWSAHIHEQWRDYIGNLPNQSEFEESILAGRVVYGPFGSYNPE